MDNSKFKLPRLSSVFFTNRSNQNIPKNDTQNDDPVLMWCHTGDVEAIQSHLKEGADPNYLGDSGTPLIISIKKQRVDLVIALLSSPKILVNLQDKGGQTPLICAAKMTDQNSDKETSLAICKLLLDRPSIQVNGQDFAGDTALMYAALLDNTKLVKYLLTAHADTNICNSMGITALHQAALRGNPDIVWYLLSHGAKKMEDTEGHLPIHFAKVPEVIELLLGKKTSVSHPFKISFIDSKLCPELDKASVGISMCPGRYTGNWHRNLEMDLQVITEWNIDFIVSTITQAELRDMGLSNLPERFQEHGIPSIHLSLHSKWLPPGAEAFYSAVELTVQLIRNGRKVLVHCNGGKGRSFLVVAACFLELGISIEKSIELFRSINPRLFHNPSQEVFLRTLKSNPPSHDLNHNWVFIPNMGDQNNNNNLSKTNPLVNSSFIVEPLIHKNRSKERPDPGLQLQMECDGDVLDIREEELWLDFLLEREEGMEEDGEQTEYSEEGIFYQS